MQMTKKQKNINDSNKIESNFSNGLEVDTIRFDENLTTFFEILLEWSKPPPE